MNKSSQHFFRTDETARLESRSLGLAFSLTWVIAS